MNAAIYCSSTASGNAVLRFSIFGNFIFNATTYQKP